MVELAKKLKNNFKSFEFTFAFATFVPKAHTPFQFCERENTKELAQRLNELNALRQEKEKEICAFAKEQIINTNQHREKKILIA